MKRTSNEVDRRFYYRVALFMREIFLLLVCMLEMLELRTADLLMLTELLRPRFLDRSSGSSEFRLMAPDDILIF